MQIEVSQLEPVTIFTVTYGLDEYGGLVGWLDRLPDGRVIVKLNGDRYELDSKKERTQFAEGIKLVLRGAGATWKEAPWNLAIKEPEPPELVAIESSEPQRSVKPKRKRSKKRST